MPLLQVKTGETASEIIQFVMETCITCHVPFMMPKYMKDKLLADKGTAFYCPNGHSMVYAGKTDAQKLKEQIEQERLKHEKDLEGVQNLLMDVMNERTDLKKQLKRVGKGVCPCCNRSFSDLLRHMQTKHPEMKKAKNLQL